MRMKGFCRWWQETSKFQVVSVVLFIFLFIVVVAAMSQIITIARGGEGLSGDGVAFVFVLCFVLYLTPGISHLAMNLLTSSILSSYYIARLTSRQGPLLPPIGRWTSLSRSRSTPTGEASLTALFLLLRPANQPTNRSSPFL